MDFTQWVQTGHRNLSYRLFAGNHTDSGTYDIQRSSITGAWNYAFCCGSAENCRTVWNGYQHQGKPDERSLCGAGSDQHIQDNRESSGGIRWCNGEKTGKSV